MTPYIAIGIGVLFLVVYRYLPERETLHGATARGAVEWTRVGMAVFVSLIVLGSAVYIVLSKDYGEPSEKWAFGAIGTIVGFWLRPEK